MTENRYRQLLWIYVALTLASVVAMLFPSYSENLALAYEKEPETGLMNNLWLAVGLMGALVLVWLVGLVGLFRFKSWARPLSLYGTVAALLTYPFMGATLESGLESALFEASAYVWGAVLALSYHSAVGARFER